VCGDWCWPGEITVIGGGDGSRGGFFLLWLFGRSEGRGRGE